MRNCMVLETYQQRSYTLVVRASIWEKLTIFLSLPIDHIFTKTWPMVKPDSREKIHVTNVVRTVMRSTMVKQYQSFCEEEGFNPLSRSTLFKILDAREASQRR